MRSVVARQRRSSPDKTAFRPSPRFTKRPPQDKRRFKPGWFELVLDLLRSYVARTGTSLVPAEHREGGFRLGRMVVYLRVRYHEGELSPERVRKLERFPGWSWDPIQDLFDRGLRHLKEFVRREGHSDVRPGHRERGFALGIWVDNKRARFRRKALPQGHVRALEAVPGWSWRGQVWDRRFHELLAALNAFVRRHRQIRIPPGYRVLGVPLGRWTILQREAYHQGRLPPARIRALEAVPGWSWQPKEDRFAERFEEGMRLLRKFAAREGHTRVPQDRHIRSGFRLGLWVMQLRQSYRLGHLGADRARRLERLPGWSWNTRPRRKAAPARRLSRGR